MGRQVRCSRFLFPNSLTANEKHPKAHINLIVMNTNYLIHFNKSAESDEVLKEFFCNENQFINEVLDKVRFNLERAGAPLEFVSTEVMSIHNLTIKVIDKRLNVGQIEHELINHMPNILVTGIIKGSVNDLVTIASASNTQIISLSLPNFRNYKYFKVRSEVEMTEHSSENSITKSILRAILVDSAAGIIVEIVKTILQSLL